MTVNRHLRYYWRIATHPKVFMFIILGAGVIFFTFCTNNNALEIAISGLASVFIGIGVNNFTAHEASLKRKERILLREQYVLKLWQLTNTKMKAIQNDVHINSSEQTAHKVKELSEVMELLDPFITGEGA